jgi:CRP-like cAMP-binding protein
VRSWQVALPGAVDAAGAPRSVRCHTVRCRTDAGTVNRYGYPIFGFGRGSHRGRGRANRNPPEVVHLSKRRALPINSSASGQSAIGVRNRLLAALPAADRARIVRTLEVVPLKLKETLHKPGESPRHVYFPGGGFCSAVTVLEDGRMIEVATIGREGMVGISAVLGGRAAGSSATIVQGATDICYRMTADALGAELDRRGPFYEIVTDYTEALIGFIMQSTACNAVHTIEQRLARWLLMAHDRMESDDFPLTQEFAAMMLGASRPTVSIVAATLQHAGLITYYRGQVTIVSRKRLEAASCECYRAATALVEAVAARWDSRHRVR